MLSRTMSMGLISTLLFMVSIAASANARVAFEKLTDYDFSGTTYYSVKNLSLYECQGWCREEQDCQAAAFSFVVNPLTPAQETLCQLQNDSSAHNPSAVAQRSASMYYMVKLQLRSENVCVRPWAFERVPNKMIRGLDNALIYTSTKEACLSACLNEVCITFIDTSSILTEWRSAEFRHLNTVHENVVAFLWNECGEMSKIVCFWRSSNNWV